MAPKSRPLKEAAASIGGARTRSPLYAAFLERGAEALNSLAETLDTYQVREAVASPSLAGTLLSALSQPAAMELLVADDPLAEARVVGVERRARLLASEGGTLASEEVAERLGISRQAVDKRRLAGKLLAIDVGRRGYRYPAWQLDGEREGGLLPGLEATLAVLAKHPPLARVRFFLTGNARLGGARPLVRLRANDVDAVVRAARAFGEQGAG